MTNTTTVHSLVCSCSLLFVLAAVFTASAATLGMQPAATGQNYVQSASLQGLQALNDTQDFSVTAHGICRYIDVHTVPGGQGLLIPFATPGEWIKGTGNTGFIATSGSRASFVTLDFCRSERDLNKAPTGNGTAVDFGPGLSANDAAVPANERATGINPAVTLETVVNAPQRRVDTTSPTTFGAFMSDDVQRPKSFNLTRNDCRTINYPDGTTNSVCTPQNWTEIVTAHFHYVLNSGFTTLGNVQTAAYNPAIGEIGSWGKTLSRSTNMPPFSPPAPMNCGSYNNGDRWWQAVAPGSQNIGCPANSVGTHIPTWTVEQEYQCYDGRVQNGAYPMAATRNVNYAENDFCQPVTNGKVGPANGKSRDTASQVIAEGLCTAGTPSPLTATATGWKWTCLGSPTGTGIDDNGTADQHNPYNLRCDEADGSLANMDGGSGVNFSCSKFNNGSNGGGARCDTTPTVTAVNRCCKVGQPNTMPFNVFGSFTVNGCDAPVAGCYLAADDSWSENSASDCIRNYNARPCEATFTAGNVYSRASGFSCIASCTSRTAHGFRFTAASCAPTPPTCTQGTEQRTSTPCPSGQSGTIIEQRDTNVGGTCGAYGNWAPVSNTCVAPVATSNATMGGGCKDPNNLHIISSQHFACSGSSTNPECADPSGPVAQSMYAQCAASGGNCLESYVSGNGAINNSVYTCYSGATGMFNIGDLDNASGGPYSSGWEAYRSFMQ